MDSFSASISALGKNFQTADGDQSLFQNVSTWYSGKKASLWTPNSDASMPIPSVEPGKVADESKKEQDAKKEGDLKRDEVSGSFEHINI